MASRLVTIAVGAALLAGCSNDQAKTDTSAQTPAASTAAQIDAAALAKHTQILASDEYEGREPGTAGEEKTVRYIAAQFEAVGLKPGNNGSWYQEVPLVEITADPSAKLQISGGKQPLVFDYRDDVVLWTKRAQDKVTVDNSDVVFVGYGINAPERGWNDYAGLDVKGKTVVVLVNEPDWQSTDGPFDGRTMTYYGRWTYKYEEAARQGAAAAIIIHDTGPAAYPWGVITSSFTGPQIDMHRADKGMSRVAVEGWMTGDAATQMFAAAGQDLAKLKVAAAQKGFKAVPLKLKASTALSNSIRRSKSRNVVGLLPGKSRPEEYVLYSAHWDHIGRCEADATGDDICNGARDNASGIAGLIELANAHVKAGAPERSVIFLAVTGEEAGLFGSQYYAENPIYPLARTVAGFNMDVLNLIGRTADIVVIGGGKSELEDYLKRAAAAQDRVVVPEPTPEKGFFYRSDHFSLVQFGVPMLYADSGNDVRGKGKEWGQAQADDYTANQYHKPGDEFDPNWNWDGAVEDLQLIYSIGRELADGTAWPNWYPTAEFRAARDASRKGAE